MPGARPLLRVFMVRTFHAKQAKSRDRKFFSRNAKKIIDAVRRHVTLSRSMSDDTTATITLTIPQELKDLLEKTAKDQDRSVSSLVRILLRDVLGEAAGEAK